MFALARLLLLYFHLVLTVALFWTKIDIVQLSVSESEYKDVSKQLDALIAIGSVCLLIKGVGLSFTYQRISLLSTMHLLADAIGSFFIFWTILDGWTWESYITILVLCG